LIVTARMNKSQKLETLANRTVLWEKETYRGQKKIHLISTLPINRGTSTLHDSGLSHFSLPFHKGRLMLHQQGYVSNVSGSRGGSP
jgi:hypothetical protein